MIGSTLSHFDIIAKIGEGGMGAVYRGKDTKLGREVAIKVLPPALTEDPARLARFEREARALAALNHPNIAAIYEVDRAAVESSTGAAPASTTCHFLAMELVDGESLAARLARGPLAPEPAAEIALQIAEALEAAHESGIVHRDLKPSNIMLRPDGGAKVLDFGLAKVVPPGATEPDLTAAPTATSPLTEAGTILGTPAYMSPEQARGEEADARSDVWALGAVLWEMLTGRRPFEADSPAELLAAILREEPDWSALPGSTPQPLRRLLRRCLAKQPRRRLQHCGDARIELGELLEDADSEVVAHGARPGGEALLHRRVSLALAGVALSAIAVALWGWMRTVDSPPPASGPVRLRLPLEAGRRLTSSLAPPVALSPDARRVAFVASDGGPSRIFLRSLDSFEIETVPHTEGASDPIFSPDGQSLAFVADGHLRKLSLRGGEPVTLCAAGERVGGATWGGDGTIVFVPEIGTGLMRVPAAGGAAEVLTTPRTEEGEIGHYWPQFLPDGRTLLFTIQTSSGFESTLLSLDTGERGATVESGLLARYLESGHLVYLTDDALHAVAFDPAAPEAPGAAASVLGAVRTFSTARGSLVYAPLGADSFAQLVWVDRSGNPRLLSTERSAYSRPRLSPDGTRLAVEISSSTGSNIWLVDLRRLARNRLTVEGGINNFATWSPDSRWITFNSTRTPQGIYRKPADGSGEPVQLLGRTYPQLPASWSPDGETLAFTVLDPRTSEDLWVLTVDGDQRRAEPLLATRFRELAPAFSPDGHWLAYVSDESGRDEVYLRAYPGPGARSTLSIDGGGEPVWSADGRELFYRRGSDIMVVSVEPGTPLRAGPPRLLFAAPFQGSSTFGYASYDVTADGEAFVMIQPSADDRPDEVDIVLDWQTELAALAPHPTSSR